MGEVSWDTKQDDRGPLSIEFSLIISKGVGLQRKVEANANEKMIELRRRVTDDIFAGRAFWNFVRNFNVLFPKYFNLSADVLYCISPKFFRFS
jgi:hypothetical protein